MNEAQKLGYDFAAGACICLLKVAIAYIILRLLLSTLCAYYGIGVDDSDQGPWHRSDLRVLRDAKTGIEYLSDGHGGLIKRG